MASAVGAGAGGEGPAAPPLEPGSRVAVLCVVGLSARLLGPELTPRLHAWRAERGVQRMNWRSDAGNYEGAHPRFRPRWSCRRR